ncbi:MAG: sugar phosphate isomerase/epimerase [Planctomycetota bacterium]|nr:sugar phosphate isomerase/epimerase [Planctomycetota bacterium]
MFNPLTRRDMIRTGLAAAGLLAAGAARPLAAGAAEAAAGAAKCSFHLGMVTYMVGAKMDLPTLIDVCEKSGLEGVELRTTHKHGVEPSLDAAGRAKVKETFAKTKVKLVALGTTCEFHAADPATVKKNIAETGEFVKLAADVGAPLVKVRPNGFRKDVSQDESLKQIGKAVAECGELAKEKGIVIVVEMHGPPSDAPNMAKIMEACKHPSCGLCWNSNAGDAKTGSVKANFDLVKQWIKHCHVRELTKNDYPWQELMTCFKGMGYTGYTMLETSTKEDPVEFLKKQRAAWEKM